MNYTHLSIEERTVISQLRVSGVSIREIAMQIGRSPSTISRELRRNGYRTGICHSASRYSPANAHSKYMSSKRRCGRKAICDPDTIDYIRSRIEAHWSPEQIANKHESEANALSASTIYRMIRQKRFGTVRMEDLRRKGGFKRPAETRGKFNDGGRTIRKWDRSVYKREELGH